MKDIYALYANYVAKILKTGDISTFKQDPKYTYMLEHTSGYQGHQYIELIRKQTKISVKDIDEFSKKNDAIGGTKQKMFAELNLTLSPSNLRYLYQAYLIIKHFQKFNKKINIVEIGGGYGGLFLAIDFLARKYKIDIDSYTIIDIPVIAKFQKLYVSKVEHKIPFDTLPSTNFGKELDKPNLFLVSCYSFAEIPREYQAKYIEVLFPKLKHGFITWNNIPVYDFGFPADVEEEVPKTGKVNKYVRF
jgi:putative sugar O-methyltransferase